MSEHETPRPANFAKGVEGIEIAYNSFGQGKSVILLHGGGQTRHSWRRTAAHLAGSGYRAITVDARGHGDSAWTDKYNLDLFAADLVTLIEQLAPGEAPAIAGASLGGLAAIRAIGGKNPPQASALILVDISTRIRTEGSAQIVNFMAANQDGFATVEEAADAVSRYMTDRPRPRDISGLRRNLRERDGRLYWHWDPHFLTGSSDKNSKRRPTDLDQYAAALKLPTLLIRGEHSEIIDQDSITHMQGLIPQLETVEVKDAGHMVAGDANTPFAAAIVDFLEKYYPA